MICFNPTKRKNWYLDLFENEHGCLLRLCDGTGLKTRIMICQKKI